MRQVGLRPPALPPRGPPLPAIVRRRLWRKPVSPGPGLRFGLPRSDASRTEAGRIWIERQCADSCGAVLSSPALGSRRNGTATGLRKHLRRKSDSTTVGMEESGRDRTGIRILARLFSRNLDAVAGWIFSLQAPSRQARAFADNIDVSFDTLCRRALAATVVTWFPAAGCGKRPRRAPFHSVKKHDVEDTSSRRGRHHLAPRKTRRERHLFED